MTKGCYFSIKYEGGAILVLTHAAVYNCCCILLCSLYIFMFCLCVSIHECAWVGGCGGGVFCGL